MKKWLAPASIMLGLAGCGDWTGYTITLTNRSQQPVSAISANFAGKVREADRLIRGQYIVLATRGGEGLACLTFLQGGVRKHYIIDYITENMPAHYQVVIRDSDISVRRNDPIDQLVGDPSVSRPLKAGTQCSG